MRTAFVLSCGFALTLLGAATLRVERPVAGSNSMRSFGPDRMAELELELWRAYYSKQRLRLFARLVTLLHEQYDTGWDRAMRAAFHLARAASAFAEARSSYERFLPDLEQGYALLRPAGDPGALARAEIAWWVARRDPQHSSPEQVGALIAKLYSILYDAPQPMLRDAGLLRARAAALRDEGGVHADWPEIGELLRASYRSLHAALNGAAPEETAGHDS